MEHPGRIYQNGRRIIDFRSNTLHVVNYSWPVNAIRSPTGPTGFPTHDYYAETWASACWPLEGLPDGEYEVVIGSSICPTATVAFSILLSDQGCPSASFVARRKHWWSTVS